LHWVGVLFGEHCPTQAAGPEPATHAWLTQFFAGVCHMPSAPHVWSCVGERHWVEFGGQLPVHTPFVQRLVQALPSFIQSPLSLHRCGDLPSVPPHCRVPGLQLPVQAPAVQRNGHGASATGVHRPALEQRKGLRASHFFASGVHSGDAASLASSAPASIPDEASRLASTVPP
jgi:hypothetical protein